MIGNYAHAVCFSCRKSWAPSAPRTGHRRGRPLCFQEKRTCPDCGKPLVGLGLAFKPPKQTDRRAWKRLEAAARAGKRFFKP